MGTQFTIVRPPKELLVGSGWDAAPILVNADGNQDIALNESPFLQYLYWDSIAGNIGFPAGSYKNPSAMGDYTVQYANLSFYRWMRSAGLVMGKMTVGSDTGTAFVLNVFRCSPLTGVWSPVGKNQIWPDAVDSSFWAFACILATVATAGIASAATAAGGTAGVSGSGASLTINTGVKVADGDYKGAIVGLAKSYVTQGLGDTVPAVAPGLDQTAAETARLTAQSAAQNAATVGVSKLDDFDIGFSNPFDGYNFSSGEASVQWSDAQNVDFGTGPFTGDFTDPQDITGFFGSASDPADEFTNPNFSFNATPEVTTNDFGTTFEGNADGSSNWGGEVSHGAIGVGAPIAIAAAAKAIPNGGVGMGASAGAGGAKQAATDLGSSDALGTIGKLWTSAVSGAGGVLSQVTTAQPKTYSGQLQAGGGAGAGSVLGMSSQTLLMVGGGLLLVALVLHAKG